MKPLWPLTISNQRSTELGLRLAEPDKGTVTPGVVKDFRRAMAGRGEKGLLITTGSFTREAEATRDIALPSS